MTEAKKPNPTSIAGGAHYHRVLATQAWKEYDEQVSKLAERTVAQRDARDLERERAAGYARQAEQK
jgi:hypothetical protein